MATLTWNLLDENRKGATTLLKVRDLCTSFFTPDDTEMPAVVDVSFSLEEGQTLALVGESGCGKTTVALSIMRLLPANGAIVGGQILFNGRDLVTAPEDELRDVRWKGVSLIFQGAMNAFNPVRTVGDQIAEALRLHLGMEGVTTRARVAELLELVGIASARAAQYPHQYSGGMRQRAMIAMALACMPQIVIADEPTTALDVMVQAQILELLEQLQKELGLAVILVTHDLGVVAEMCQKVVVMYGGKVAEYADVDTIYNSPQHPYTQRLLEAFPDLNRPGDSLASIPGYPPRLSDLPPGCRFEPRCSLAFDRCRVEDPAVRQVAAGHWVACHLVEGKPGTKDTG
jgi:oligopeptide/dipeptide ABC transporter ATP-binding protein